MTRAYSPKGFTITELLIATAVFSLILTGAIAGFLQIGRMFYKGVSVTQTQENAQTLLNSLRDGIAQSANVSSAQSGGGYTYYCIGNVRYTYNINKMVDQSADSNYSSGGNFGLLRDVMPGSTACATPCVSACPAGGVALNKPQELLGHKNRLGNFSIVQPDPAAAPNLYKLDLTVVYGDDEVLDFREEGNPATLFCTGNLSTQQFCAVSSLSTSVYRGLSL
ncbi:MAG: prepilin-type N-terminal cleavage/methylation domain-containing protein [Candidatus Saccharimonadales bacterium]